MSRSNKVVVLVCDVQQRFAGVIHGWEHLLDSAKFILEVARLLNLETVVTEQYPKGLGRTVEELRPVLENRSNVYTFEKLDFSMMSPDVQEKIKNSQAVVLFGLEAHVCVLQTCQDLLLLYPAIGVYLPVDAISSSRPFERTVALRRMAAQPNVQLTTCESLAFELLYSASHPQFKAVSALVKARSARLYQPAGSVQAAGVPVAGGTQGPAQAETTLSGSAVKRIEPVLCTME
jgi:nicotinamidase-related amidase